MKKFGKAAFMAALVGISALAFSGCGKKDDGAEGPADGYVYVPEYAQMELACDYIDSNRMVVSGDDLFIFAEEYDEEAGRSARSLYKYDLLENKGEKLPVEIGENCYVNNMALGSDGNLFLIVDNYIAGENDAGSTDTAGEEPVADTTAADEEPADGTATAAADEELADATATAAADEEPADGTDTTAADEEPADADTAAADEDSAADGPDASMGEGEAAEAIVRGTNALELWTVSTQDGSVASSKEITGIMGDTQYSYVQYFCADGQGNLYFGNGDNAIFVFDKDLNKICEITTDNWINCMATSKEGDVYILTYGETGLVLKKVDLATKKLGEPMEGINDRYGNLRLYASAEKSFLMSSSNTLSRIDLAAGTSQEEFSWLDVDVDGNSLAMVGELSDGRFWAIVNENSPSASTAMGERSFGLIYLSRKKASEVPKKDEIVLGTMWLNSDVRSNLIDFNKTNEKYRITVKEYGGDDPQAGLTQFNADLTTANCPDIIDLSALDHTQYVSKGVLEDLYPYMEKSGFKKEDYLENVLKAFEMDGKLYGIMPNFFVSSVMAKTSLVGDVEGWTLSEMLDFVENKNPENVFQYGGRINIFYYCIYNNIDEFIDWESGKCSFDGEDFVRTLEFAAKFPEEPDFEEEREGISSLLRSDKVLLMQSTLSSVQEYQMMNGLFGEKATYIGYPNSQRKGNLIQANSGCLGMSSKSKHKEGAWEFMQIILTEEYQDALVREHGSWGFPIKKSALEKQFEKDMTPEYYEDENGNKVEQSKTTWGYDDFQMDIMAATKEEVDAVRALISSAERLYSNTDEQLMSIITEEAEPFFKGQKSAADVAAVIQNRIQIYVNENM